MRSVRTVGILTALALITAQLAVFPASADASSRPGLHPRLTESHSQVAHHGKLTKSAKKVSRKGSRRVSQQPAPDTVEICKSVQFIQPPWSTTFDVFVGSSTRAIQLTLTSSGSANCARLQDQSGAVLLIPLGTKIRIVESLVPPGVHVEFAGSNLADCTPPANGCKVLTVAPDLNTVNVLNVALQPPGPAPGTLKICKQLVPGLTAPPGTLFTFSVSGRATPVAVAPGTCALLTNVPAGPTTVTETGPAGYIVTDISFLAGTGISDTTTRTAVANVVAGLTVEVQFTDRASTP